MKYLLVASALLASVTAQFAKYQNGPRSLAVNIPDATASSGSGSIYFQISAPSGTQWLAVGQGTEMSDANMFVIYASGNTPVLSPRSTNGHVMPQFNPSTQATMLPGSGVQSDGSIVVNVRCDSCLKWSSGTMNPIDRSSNWIMAYKSGSALGNSDQSATITRHDDHDQFTLDLTAGVGGNSQNPFVASSASSSGAASGTAAATSGGPAASATSGISQPVASTSPGNSAGSTTSSSSNNTDSLRQSHGILMTVLFLALFPFFALTLYLPIAIKVRFIHAPLQIISVILLIVGMSLGIVVGQRIDELDTYHQIIGFIVVFVLVLIQPTMGLLQHLHFHKTGGRSMWGPLHQWLGRAMITLGVINGGLGWNLAETTDAYVPYAVVAAIVFVIYVGVVIWCKFGPSSRRSVPMDKEQKSSNGYEMHNSHRRLDSENGSPTTETHKTNRI